MSLLAFSSLFSRQRLLFLLLILFSCNDLVIGAIDDEPLLLAPHASARGVAARFAARAKDAAPISLAAKLDGRVCMTVESLRPTPDNSSFFYECAPLSKEEMAEFGLSDKYLGIWHRRSCPERHQFEEEQQKCKDTRVMRRQPLGCDKNPFQIGCGIPCPVTYSATPVVGEMCDWMSATLQPDSGSPSFFLQCIQNPGQTCGEWVRQPCASGTVYDSSNSICVPAVIIMRDQACGDLGRPVCQCAQHSVQNSCPGTATCQQNVCCLTVTVQPATALIQNQGLIQCPGTFAPPNGPCGDGCQGTCVQNIGCCPSVTITLPPIVALCPNSYSPPVGQCSACPVNTVCEQSINSCCPTATAPNPSITLVLQCPNGQPASSACGMNGACPPGTGCYQGGCCPMSCPAGQILIGFCSSGGCGGGSCWQESGCCCQQEAAQLPVCQNGVQAIQRCSLDQECGPTLRCSNGGCCPIPYCPSGVQSIARCFGTGQAGCGGGMACMDGVCCPLPRCPTGLTALGTCSRSLDCGPAGFECANGGCCPLPQCPGGSSASQRCSTVCPVGFVCLGGGCCPLPVCPSTGSISVASCLATPCALGFECVNGGCCQLPQCPNGALANQRCQMAVGCPNGQVCENGVCCSLPSCSIGILAIASCGMANSCPAGYVCEGRGCCPEPMPLCPNGGRSPLRCSRGSDCAPGYGCTPLGGCCLLSMEPVCQGSATPVCQCSASNGCPSGSACQMGTCCALAAIPVTLMPGSTCLASPQCNGFSSQCAQCVQGVCSCTGGAASNGVACLQIPTASLQVARSGCDQYGSPCKFVLSTTRRRPIFAPTGNVTEQPLFFHVTKRRRCVANATEIVADPDASCLPNEKCIDGQCKQKLWPGEYGCQLDGECSARCPNTYCENRKGDQPGVSQCQCKEGLLLYGRCFTECPEGFHESGAHCVHDNEESFWKNGQAQEKLAKLLNDGTC